MGNTQSNTLDCTFNKAEDSKSCMAIGYTGGDVYKISHYNNKALDIRGFDFNKKTDGSPTDQVYIGDRKLTLSDLKVQQNSDGTPYIELPYSTVTDDGRLTSGDRTSYKRRITFTGIERWRVERWLDIALNPRKYQKTDIDSNPIIFE